MPRRSGSCPRAPSRRARLSRGAAEPHAERRQAQRLLGDGQQQHAGGGQPEQEGYPGYRNPDEFRGRLGRIPDGDRDGSRPGPAHGDVGREGRRIRQCRAAHAVLAPAGRGAGRGALRPVAADGVLQALQGRGSVAGGAAREEARVQGQDAVRHAVSQRRRWTISRSRTSRRATPTTRRRPSASMCRRDCSRSTRTSAAATATTSRRSTPITRCAACAGRWSTARRRSGATSEGTDPYVKAGKDYQFYGNPDGKALHLRAALRAARRIAGQGIPVVAVDRARARALALGLDDATRAGAVQGVPQRGVLHASGRRGGARRAPRRTRSR